MSLTVLLCVVMLLNIFYIFTLCLALCAELAGLSELKSFYFVKVHSSAVINAKFVVHIILL